MKIVEKQFIENEKEKQNMDKDIRQLNEKIQRDDIKYKENILSIFIGNCLI